MRDPGEILITTHEVFKRRLQAVPKFRLPEYGYTTFGQVVLDQREQFVTVGVSVYQGWPGSNQPGYQADTGGVAVTSFDFAVLIAREVPLMDNSNNFIRPEEHEKATRNVGEDTHLLIETFHVAMEENEIASACDIIYYGGITYIGPSGGSLGTQLNMSIQLD